MRKMLKGNIDVDVDVDEYNQIVSIMKCFRKPAM